MDTRLATVRGTWGHVIAPGLAMALLMGLIASSAAAAAPTACRVKNTSTAKTYSALQAAVDAAKSGDRLTFEGVCHGGTVIDKDLVIVGQETSRSGKPLLDGDGDARVLTIKSDVKVDIRNLVVVRGRTHAQDGGGIANKGRLRLRDVAVRANKAVRGAGIYNEGVVHLDGRSRISRNGMADVIGTSGAGVYNAGRLVLGGSSRIYQNRCSGLSNVGTVIMRGTSSIGQNTTGQLRYCGGSSNSGSLVMNDASSIRDDEGLGNGGTLTMNDTSSIHGNSVGGGVANTGTLTMNDASSIHDNSTWGGPTNPTGRPGGGVHNTGTLTMNDESSIHHNRVTAGAYGPVIGGGVYNEGTLTMTGSSRITENGLPNRPNYGEIVPGQGGGLYNASGGVLVGVDCGANVYGNTPDDCYFEP